ncbi:MAG: hypothetical protein HYV60_07660 [Planctomycetia bacterium]|nr:hypothetical protein [Planctomycetia bacterium]
MSQSSWAPLIAGQAGVVPLSRGIPGVAKTAFFEALAQASQRRFIPYMLDLTLPEDLKGYPLVQDIEANGRPVRAMVHIMEEARLRAELEPFSEGAKSGAAPTRPDSHRLARNDKSP